MKKQHVLAVALCVVVSPGAIALELDPGFSLDSYPAGNQGTDDGRGVWFQADVDYTVYDGGWYNDFADGNSFTMNLRASDASGDLFGSILGSFTIANTGDTTSYVNGTFAGPINLTAGNYYNLEVVSTSAFDANWYYDWDNVPVDIGPFTLLDGHRGSGTGLANTLAPALQVNAVPEPATMTLLGLGALAALRKKRKS